MILWNLLLLLLQLVWTVQGDVNNPHEGCRKSNELYLDKIVKTKAGFGYTSIWDVNDVIVLDLNDRKGTMNLVVPKGVELEQKYVDERILKLSVDNREKFNTLVHTIEIQYQTQRHCSEDGVHYMHFEVTNSLRNSSNELVLKYRQVCHQIAEQHLSLQTNWIQDGHCPGPLKDLRLDNQDAVLYTFIYDRGTRVYQPRADTDGHIVWLLAGNGTVPMNVRSNNPETLLISNHTKEVDFSHGMSFAITEYYSKKPGNATIRFSNYWLPYTVVPSFTEFWDSSIYGSTNLSTEEPATIFKVMHYDPQTNVGVEFDGPDGNNVFTIQKEFRENDEIALVMKGNTTGNSITFLLENNVRFKARATYMKYHVALIPYRDLLSINQLGYMYGDQSIKVKLCRASENGTSSVTNYTLDISAPVPTPPSMDLGTSESPVTEIPEALELSELKTYSLGNDSSILMDTEENIHVDADGIYQIYKDKTNFQIVFTIKGTWNKLKVKFSNEHRETVSRSLKAGHNTWKLLFKGVEGEHKLILNNEETGEKKEYSVRINFKGKSIIHPPDN